MENSDIIKKFLEVEKTKRSYKAEKDKREKAIKLAAYMRASRAVIQIERDILIKTQLVLFHYL